MYEDDGGYADVAKSITAIGEAVTAIGSTLGEPLVAGAGALILLVGGITSLIASIDDDEYYGMATKNWGSQAQLVNGVGPYTLAYRGEDWAGDSYDFDLSIELATAS
jgi:hypothetical protein